MVSKAHIWLKYGKSTVNYGKSIVLYGNCFWHLCTLDTVGVKYSSHSGATLQRLYSGV